MFKLSYCLCICISKMCYVESGFQQQANMDAYEVQLKHEQDKCTKAQTKLSQIKVRAFYMSNKFVALSFR